MDRKRAILEELYLRNRFEFWRKHPLVWLKERFGEDPKSFEWSEFGGPYLKHKWDGDPDPIANLWKDLANGDWGALFAATGTSKTYFLSRLVFWFLDCHKDCLVVTSAPKESQLKLHLWAEIGRAFPKFKKIRPEAVLNTLDLSLRDSTDSDNPYDGWKAKGFVAGVGADETSATKAQGFHRKDMLIICEETPGMSGAVMTAFKNTSTAKNNIIVAVGNPDSELDELSAFAESKRVKSYRISAYDYPNVVLKRPIFQGGVEQISIDQRKDDYGEDSDFFKSRVRGISPKESSDSLIKLKWIEDCIDAKIEDDFYYYPAAGVDVANSESGDLAAIAYGIGSSCVNIIEFQCPSASDIAYNLLYDKSTIESIRSDIKERGRYAVREHLSAKDTNLTTRDLIIEYPIETLDNYSISPECVGIDTVGVGASTINTFTNLGYSVCSLSGGEKAWEEAIVKDSATGVPLVKFVNLRAQMYWELREDFSKNKLSLLGLNPNTLKQLKKELTAIRFEIRANAIGIEKKDDIIKRLGKSPNLADALAYWNWMRKGYRLNSLGALPFMG